MRKFPIEDIKKYILYRLKFQQLPEWYSEWLSQESRLLKIAQVLEKLREIDETTASEIDDLWAAVAAAGGEGSDTLLQRITALEEYRNQVSASISSIETEMDAIADNINTELTAIDGRIEALEDQDIDLSPVFQQISTLSTSVDSRFDAVNGALSDMQEEIDGIEAGDPFDPSDILADIASLQAAVTALQEQEGFDPTAILADIDALKDAVTDLQNDPGFDPTDILAEISTIKSDITALQEQEGFDPTEILTALDTLETDLESAETRITALENAPGGGGGGTVDIRGAAPIAVEDVESEGETWKEVSFDGDGIPRRLPSVLNNANSVPVFIDHNGVFSALNSNAWGDFSARGVIVESSAPLSSGYAVAHTGGSRPNLRAYEYSYFIDVIIKTLPGYDASSVQSLKNVNGEVQWVDDE